MTERVSRRPARDDEAHIDEVLTEVEQTTRPIEAYGITERSRAVLETRTRRLGILAAAAGMTDRIDAILAAAAPPEDAPKPHRPDDELVDA